MQSQTNKIIIFIIVNVILLLILYKIPIRDNKILENVNMLDKGESLLLFNNNNIKLHISSNNYENKLIKGDENEYFSCN